MSGTCISYEMCQCKTMFGAWHRHKYVRASVRPCLGHGVGLDDDSQCKTTCLGHGIDLRYEPV
ncbi:ETO1-like protein 2 [Gossypium arboreum]|uniref:ETO1-like protein 2 n=1 Tax=Gossypium arboreum TaxID=29729 RepID=A0A0B0P565_GOSAR|nr:ETO1-like protein 2 [Gossypium arboreum]